MVNDKEEAGGRSFTVVIAMSNYMDYGKPGKI